MNWELLPYGLPALLSSICAYILAIFVYNKFPKTSTIKIFYITIFLLGSINFIDFNLRLSNSHNNAILWSKLFAAIWPFIIATTIQFIVTFRNNIFSPRYLFYIIYIPAILISYSEISTNLITLKPILQTWGYTILPSNNIYYTISTIWAISILLISQFHIYKTYRKSSNKKKKQALWIFISLLINIILGVTTDVVLQVLRINFPPMGYALSVVSFVIITYSIFRYKLFLVSPESISSKVIETISDLIFVINSKYEIIEINKSALTVLGKKREDLIGKNVSLISSQIEEICKQNKNKEKENIELELQISIVSNKETNFSFSYNSIFLENNKDNGYVFTGRNLTERKQQEISLYTNNLKLEELVSKRTENLRNANKRLIQEISNHDNTVEKLIETIQNLETSERSKMNFIHNLSHEMKSPINAIHGFADFLQDDDINEKDRKEFASTILNSSRQLIGIIDDTVKAASDASNNITTKVADFNLNSVLNSILNQFKIKIDKSKIELSCYKSLADNEATICTDQIKFTQIITNLISNSLKFTEKGYINFGYTIEKNNFVFFVRDTGIGIAKEHHTIIFERFRQADADIKKKYGGSGIGLSIVKQYVKLLEGEIWLESDENKGSNFYFSIPIKK